MVEPIKFERTNKNNGQNTFLASINVVKSNDIFSSNCVFRNTDSISIILICLSAD